MATDRNRRIAPSAYGGIVRAVADRGARGGAPDPTPSVAAPMLDYMMSGKALFRFSSDPNGPAEGDQTTIWEYDRDENTLKPFLNEGAFYARYGKTVGDAVRDNEVNVVSPGIFGEGRLLEKVTLLSSKYGVRPDGKSLTLGFNPVRVRENYGKPRNEQAERTTMEVMKNILDAVKADPANPLPPEAIDAYMNDPAIMEFYMKAMTYGGYTAGDMVKDMLRRSNAEAGDIQADQAKFISDSRVAKDYAYSADYRKAESTIPAGTMAKYSIPRPVLDSPLADMPDEYFSNFAPTVDVDSDVFKQTMDSVTSYAHDLAEAVLKADTEQKRQVAQAAWDKFRTDVDLAYGWKLSDNAVSGLSQLNSLYASHSQKGTILSGEEQYAVDKTARDVMKADERIRLAKKDETAAKEMEYYTKYGTPEELQKLIEEDKAKGLPQSEWRVTKWGMMPTQEFRDSFSLEKMKAKYPGADEATLKMASEAYLDQYGLKRASAYATEREKTMQIEKGYTPSSMPSDSRMLAQKKKAAEILQTKEQEAYKEIDGQKAAEAAKNIAEAPKDTRASSLPAGWTMDDAGHPVPPKAPATPATPAPVQPVAPAPFKPATLWKAGDTKSKTAVKTEADAKKYFGQGYTLYTGK